MNPLSSSPADVRLLEEFELLWEHWSSPPDLVEFVSKRPQIAVDQVALLLNCDLQYRTRHGYDVPTRRYLSCLPGAAFDDVTLRAVLAAEKARGEQHDEADDLSTLLVGLSPDFSARIAREWQNLQQQVSTKAPEPVGDTDRVSSAAPPRAILPRKESGPLPERIGRYRVVILLGTGGFGAVYRAIDEDLRRDVAIKVPHEHLLREGLDVEAYLNEARVLARLDHHGLVPVLDAGYTSTGSCYVVYKFVEGQDLSKLLETRAFEPLESARLICEVAQSLMYTHAQGIVHRDIKPANILVDRSGRTYVADFGLALREEDFGRGHGLAGTPAYMSPEQARGEGHRVDGRSDIFSLGVVFYQMLTSKRPFGGTSRAELFDNICTLDVRPPRQLNPTIPRELERICLRALAKRASERYGAMADLVDDLQALLASAPAVPQVRGETPSDERRMPESPSRQDSAGSHGTPLAVLPKGLRSFDEEDATFFLQLLPGTRDRHGLPENVRFWKSRLEELDADRTFKVGVLYGPSGCGKSSLMRAAILPRVSAPIMAVYVEATPTETESRLLRAMRKIFPSLSQDLDLPQSLAMIRRHSMVPTGGKLVIVLDQFEQWLHARLGGTRLALIDALRQADGARIQVVVMVRDDFWMATTQFMRELEIRIVEGENAAAVELFDLRHAGRVLEAFGEAFRVTGGDNSSQRETKRFVEQTVNELAQHGKVMPVRVALFAEMMKDKAWTPATLRALGGVDGIGVRFLEEALGDRTLRIEHRIHQRACRSVLRALLPEKGSEIKGQMRSREELSTIAGYQNRQEDFDDVLRILDRELRLITPTDPEGTRIIHDSAVTTEPPRYYQLAHDYLVVTTREWLEQQDKLSPWQQWLQDPARATQAGFLAIADGIFGCMVALLGMLMVTMGALGVGREFTSYLYSVAFLLFWHFPLISTGILTLRKPVLGLKLTLGLLVLQAVVTASMLNAGNDFGGLFENPEVAIHSLVIVTLFRIFDFGVNLLAFVGQRAGRKPAV